MKENLTRAFGRAEPFLQIRKTDWCRSNIEENLIRAFGGAEPFFINNLQDRQVLV